MMLAGKMCPISLLQKDERETESKSELVFSQQSAKKSKIWKQIWTSCRFQISMAIRRNAKKVAFVFVFALQAMQ
jgi:hypothetical protein